MKKILFSIILLLGNVVFALDISDLIEPKPMEGRLSNTDKVEKIKKEENKTHEKKVQLNHPVSNKENIEQTTDKIKEEKPQNYADLSLKKLASDVSFELEMDEAEINSDLSILWQAVTARSETIKYTVYKLSNPDEDKPDESAVKKILKPLTNVSSIAGASLAADPYLATGALIGGGLVNAFMKDDKEANYRFSKVSDADMVLLVRKIDELQKKLLDLYIDYKTKEQLAKMTDENYKKREEIYKNAQSKSKEELLIADTNYRNAKNNAQKAQDDFLTSKTILENLAGVDALKQIEKR